MITSAWFGLATGLIELGMLAIRRQVYSEAALGALQMNRHFPWMIPTANLVLFVGWGTLVGLAAWMLPAVRRLRLPALVFLAALAMLLAVERLHAASCLILALGAAYRLAPRLTAREARVEGLARASIVGLAGVVVGLGATCYHRVALAERRALAALPAALPAAPNVVLIVLDTVRADHLSLYGYDRDTTPNLARLARRGVRFDKARSTAPWTLPSHSSMFTGRWPSELFRSEHLPLGNEFPTLAEFLRGRGYHTAGFVANMHFCNSWFGLARGFVHYEDHFDAALAVSPSAALRTSELGRRALSYAEAALGLVAGPVANRKDAARINRDFLGWLAARSGPKRPFFAFLNYMDAHSPYLVPDASARHFGVRPTSAADIEVLLNWDSSEKRGMPPRSITLAHDSYDDCLAYLDAQLGRLFDELERRGVLNETLLIVTSDHGEHFGEHSGLFSHAQSLHRPELDVPLLLVAPRGVPAGRTIDEPVSLRDLPATITHWLGLGRESPFLGQPLARCWDEGLARSLSPDAPVLSETSIGIKTARPRHKVPALRGEMSALMNERYSYIRIVSAGRCQEELYDLVADAGETRDLADSHASRPVLEEFRDEYQRLRSASDSRVDRLP